MNETYIQDKTFEATDFTKQPLAQGDYDGCIFNNCNFYETDLSGCMFIDCRFNGCNLSLAKLEKTGLRDVAFKDCKMLGLRFDTCLEFGVTFSFDNCQLDHSSFYQRKIKKTVFNNCRLNEVDFAGSDLSGAVFDKCDLNRANFENTILEKADFRTAYNYSIDPEMNKMKKAKFSLNGLAGLLEKYDIVIEN
jgi:fluoroquinolone resistance protein